MAINFLTHTHISQILKEQQETIGVVDQYLQSILLDPNDMSDSHSHADFVMQHVFVNIRNSYQDGILISQKLVENNPYYISTSLSHAQRSAQEFLIDLAYIMSDLKNKKGNEYLRYLKFILTIENKHNKRLGLDNISTEDFLKKNFPPDLELPKRGGQWTDTSRKDKIEKGLKFYKIEPDHFADHRLDFHSFSSSAAHGNPNTIYTFIRTPEDNLPKLEADLSISILEFEKTLESALKCYIHFYLGRPSACKNIIDSMIRNKQFQIHNLQA